MTGAPAQPSVRADYLVTAASAGVLQYVGGLPYVAGEFRDEAGNELQALVEYCDPHLLAGSAPQLLTQLHESFPGADALVVRTPGPVTLDPPWRPHLTYIRHAAPPTEAPPAPIALVTRVRAAGPADEPLLLDWFARALTTYGQEQGHVGDPDRIAAVAQQLLADSGRRSFVVATGDRPFGHVTLLCDAFDDVSIGPYVELFDTLVDASAEERGPAMSALVEVAVRHARLLDLPLVGHVVHPAPTGPDVPADKVLRSLLTRGWMIDHRYWRLPRSLPGGPDGA